MRAVFRILVGLVGLVAIYFLAGTIGGIIPGRTADLPQGADRTVLLVPGPIHTDILLPLDPDVAAHFAFAEVVGVPVTHPMGEWLAVGWGAREFYTTVGDYGDVSASAIWKAMTGDNAVIRLEIWGRLPDNHGLTEFNMSEAQFVALIDTIDAALLTDGQATPIAHPGFSEADGFFEAAGRFSPLRTCNSWVGKVLRSAGVQTGAWTPFTWSLP